MEVSLFVVSSTNTILVYYKQGRNTSPTCALDECSWTQTHTSQSEKARTLHSFLMCIESISISPYKC